jgi:hypothetical protein
MQGTDGWQKKFLRFVIFKALITWNLWISENVLRFLYSFTQAAPRIYFVFTAISFQQIHICFDIYFSGLKGDWQGWWAEDKRRTFNEIDVIWLYEKMV